jgi:hypothetical protein
VNESECDALRGSLEVTLRYAGIGVPTDAPDSTDRDHLLRAYRVALGSSDVAIRDAAVVGLANWDYVGALGILKLAADREKDVFLKKWMDNTVAALSEAK